MKEIISIPIPLCTHTQKPFSCHNMKENKLKQLQILQTSEKGSQQRRRAHISHQPASGCQATLSVALHHHSAHSSRSAATWASVHTPGQKIWHQTILSCHPFHIRWQCPLLLEGTGSIQQRFARRGKYEGLEDRELFACQQQHRLLCKLSQQQDGWY